MRDSVTGNQNVAIGAQCMLASNGSEDCVAIGYQALSGAHTGSWNTAIGAAALGSNTSAGNNTAVGRRALADNTAADNTAVGSDAAVAVTSGTRNVAVGRIALAAVTTAENNTAVGHGALTALTGANNTAVGRAALNGIGAGSANTAVGEQALASLTSGTNNTAIGRSAASAITTNTNTTALGFQAAPNGDNQVVLGNASIATLRCQVTTITALSDERDKTDIVDLPLGLDFIRGVQVRKFTWDMRDGAKVGGTEAGVIAQELLSLQKTFHADWFGLVDETNPDRLEATPGKLLFPLLRAVQELAAQVQELRGDDKWREYTR